MLEKVPMPRGERPKGIPEDELYQILRSKARDPENKPLSTNLSKEVHRIIGSAAKRFGVDKRTALEIIIRQWRELSK